MKVENALTPTPEQIGPGSPRPAYWKMAPPMASAIRWRTSGLASIPASTSLDRNAPSTRIAGIAVFRST